MEPIQAVKETLIFIVTELFLLIVFTALGKAVILEVAKDYQIIVAYVGGLILGVIEGIIAISFIHYMQEY